MCLRKHVGIDYTDVYIDLRTQSSFYTQQCQVVCCLRVGVGVAANLT